LGLDALDNLSYYAVPESRTIGSIARYIITPSYDEDSVAVYMLAEGRLICIAGIGGAGNPRIKQELDGGEGGVEAFGFAWDVPHELGGGWFTVPREGRREVFFFLSRNNRFSVRLRPCRAHSKKSVRAEALTDFLRVRQSEQSRIC
jgi:hypothetical protein